MAKEQHRAMLICKMPIACGGCHFLKEILGRYVCSASGQASLLNCIDAQYLTVDDEAHEGKRHKDCPLLPVQDVEDAHLKAQLTIKDLLSKKCSPCHFCARNNNPDAGCKHLETNERRGWCERYAVWNGKISED